MDLSLETSDLVLLLGLPELGLVVIKTSLDKLTNADVLLVKELGSVLQELLRVALEFSCFLDNTGQKSVILLDFIDSLIVFGLELFVVLGLVDVRLVQLGKLVLQSLLFRSEGRNLTLENEVLLAKISLLKLMVVKLFG